MTTKPDTPRNHGDHDAPHVSPVTPGEDIRSIAINDVNWGAVLAGVACGLILQLLLNMLGLGFGLATLDPGTNDNPSAAGFGIGAGIWWVLSALFASFTGGWIAGRLAGKSKETTAGLHGVVSWAVTSLIVIYMLTSAVSGIVGGALGALGSAAGGIARTAGSAVSVAAPAAAVNPQASNAVSDAASSIANNPKVEEIAQAAKAGVQAAVSDDPAAAARAREEAAQALATSRNIPIEQARAQTAQTEQQVTVGAEKAKQTATRAADATAGALSSAALLSAIALLLGALAAWFGGRAGAPNPTVTGGRRL